MTAGIVGNQDSHQNEGDPLSFSNAWTTFAVFVNKDFNMIHMFTVSHADT